MSEKLGHVKTVFPAGLANFPKDLGVIPEV